MRVTGILPRTLGVKGIVKCYLSRNIVSLRVPDHYEVSTLVTYFKCIEAT